MKKVFLAIAVLIAATAIFGRAYVRFGDSPQSPSIENTPISTEQFQTLVQADGGAVLRHESGAQLKILPGTFVETTNVNISVEEAPPLKGIMPGRVWTLEADCEEFAKPIELVLPVDNQISDQGGAEHFGVYWNGTQWSRVPSTVLAGDRGVRVQAEHFSLWSVVTDPTTLTGNDQAIPALLTVQLPEMAIPGEEITVRFAAANLGASDLSGYGVVVAEIVGGDGEAVARSARLKSWDGTDGALGSIVYVSDSTVAASLEQAMVVDAESLSPLILRMPEAPETRVRVHLDFYGDDGSRTSSSIIEKIVKAAPDDAESDVTAATPAAQSALPERVDIVRIMGSPLHLLSNGSATETFDDAGTFSGELSRDVAREWGAYQVGVVAHFAGDLGGGLEATNAQVLEARGARRLGIMRQVTGLHQGNTYYISLSYLLSPLHDGDMSQQTARLGIDLTGGADPSSPEITWSEGSTTGEWMSLVLAEVVAGDKPATIFLELECSSESEGAILKIDNLDVQTRKTREMPDLKVERIWLEQPTTAEGCSNQAGVLYVQVINQGGGRAPSFDTVVSGTGSNDCGPWRVRGLEPGEVFVYSCPLTIPGKHNVRVVADAGNVLGESNENNNWSEAQVMVAAPCPPTPTPTPTGQVTATPAATPTPSATSTPTPVPTSVSCGAGSPLCVGNDVSFRYLGSDWTMSIDGWRKEADVEDARWVKIIVWGTITRDRRHQVEKLIAGVGDADFGKALSLTLIDDHGHEHVATGAVIDGPLSVERRLQFEDIRDLWGTFTFEVTQFPQPSAVGSAVLGIGPIPGDGGEGTPLQFLYTLTEGCCAPADSGTIGEPHFSPNVAVGSNIQVMPYLHLDLVDMEVSEDGSLLTIDLALRNRDYVVLKPTMGAALVVNGDWTFGAYLGNQGEEPVNWRDAGTVWGSASTEGVPPLTEQAPQPNVLRFYALAPAGVGGWDKPVLYLPELDAAMELF